jgi:hypothetical protein
VLLQPGDLEQILGRRHGYSLGTVHSGGAVVRLCHWCDSVTGSGRSRW